MSLIAGLQARCIGCLGPLGAAARAGLCGSCWEGLQALPEDRCPRCAQPHPWAEACPEPVAWALGDALWDYHGGWPALGALLVPGIKAGERGWKAALLARTARVPLPAFTGRADLVCAAPTSGFRRWWRGFDLAEEAARMFAARLGLPWARLLIKPWLARAQSGLPESRRRRLGAGVVRPARDCRLSGQMVLLVDDVWTTGTTLLRAAQALRRAGAGGVLALTLFRAWRRQAPGAR